MSASCAPVRIQMTTLAVLLLIFLEAPATASDASNAGSDTSAPGDKLSVIDVSSAPAAPPESVEARIALRQHREATALNRFTFSGNVLEGTGDLVEHWIVMFCPGWDEKCQGLLPSYELLGVQWENKLNKALMSSTVRFVKVDCATEKSLCVSLDISDYPSVVHYRNRKRINSWHGGAPGLVRFVKQELETPKKRHKGSKHQATLANAFPTCSATDAPTTETAAEDGHGRLALALRSICCCLVLLAVVRCIYVLATRGVSGLCRADTSSKPTLTSRLVGTQGYSSHSEGVTKEQQRVPLSASLEACLPEEWALERPYIVL